MYSLARIGITLVLGEQFGFPTDRGIMTNFRTAAVLTAGLLAAGLGAAPVHADPLPYGEDTCIQGFVWREAREGDTVCVTPDVRTRVAEENSNPALNRQPGGGAYGPDTCAQGFVWREAFDGDTICVTPDNRDQTLADNAAAESRYQRNQTGSEQVPANSSTVVFEVFGSGEVYSIWIDPGGQGAGDHTQLPWKKTFTAGPEVTYFAVSPTGRETPGPGCRITIDGQVVAEQAIGSGNICTFTR